jgi:hypothetical protein
LGIEEIFTEDTISIIRKELQELLDIAFREEFHEDIMEYLTWGNIAFGSLELFKVQEYLDKDVLYYVIENAGDIFHLGLFIKPGQKFIENYMGKPKEFTEYCSAHGSPSTTSRLMSIENEEESFFFHDSESGITMKTPVLGEKMKSSLMRSDNEITDEYVLHFIDGLSKHKNREFQIVYNLSSVCLYIIF